MNGIYKAHPWHGVLIGDKAPAIVTCYIEIVPSDTVKYEIDKSSGLLKIDRPQRYSNICPTLYGFIPQTYCGILVAEFTMKKTGKSGLKGDCDPLDICVLAENVIPRGDILLQAVPIGGIRMIDAEQVDDKIIGTLQGDAVYGQLQDVSECPDALIERLKHYFLTYKRSPEQATQTVEITHVYGRFEAHEVIDRSRRDYVSKYTPEGGRVRPSKNSSPRSC